MRSTILEPPTIDLVKARGDEFDRDLLIRLDEDALGQLRAHFPQNTEIPHVLLKVLALNELYSVRVPDIDVKVLARHIAGLGVDPLLADGLPCAVDRITSCDELSQNCYSFATKYCSWHNPDAYPIYDTRVDECLWSYKKQDGHKRGYPKFQRKQLRLYPKLRETVTEFCNFYNLGLVDPLNVSSVGSFNFKAIDKFLWKQGDNLLSDIS